MASAHAVSQPSSQQHMIHVTLKHTTPTAKVTSSSFRCYTKNFNSKLGHICVTIYLQCAGPFCVVYAVDIFFNQNALDGLVAAGAGAAGIIASFLGGAPLTGIVASIVAGALGAIDYLARVVCDGNGAGVYLGYPALVPSPHC